MQTKKEETKQKLNLNCKDCSKNLQKCTCMKDTIDMKQETIEEASKKLILDKWLEDDKVPNLVKWGIEIGFEQAKEMEKEQQGYSEEEAYSIWQAGQNYGVTSGSSITFEELTKLLRNKKR